MSIHTKVLVSNISKLTFHFYDTPYYITQARSAFTLFSLFLFAELFVQFRVLRDKMAGNLESFIGALFRPSKVQNFLWRFIHPDNNQFSSIIFQNKCVWFETNKNSNILMYPPQNFCWCVPCPPNFENFVAFPTNSKILIVIILRSRPRPYSIE